MKYVQSLFYAVHTNISIRIKINIVKSLVYSSINVFSVQEYIICFILIYCL